MEDYIDDIPKLKVNRTIQIRILKRHLRKIITCFIVLVLGIYTFAIFKNPAFLGPLQGFKIGPVALPASDPNIEQKRVIEQVGKLIKLPNNETPTVASIVDITKLPNQPFFKDAKNGDKLLIFPVSKTAILYDPAANQIVQVGPLTNSSSPSVAQNQARIVLRNGTSVSGLANKVEVDIKKNFPTADIINKDNASNTEYNKTIVVVLNNGAKDAATALAKVLNATLSGLPSGETKVDGAEILVIIGKDKI